MKNKLTKAQLLEVVNSLPGPTVSPRTKNAVIEEIINERQANIMAEVKSPSKLEYVLGLVALTIGVGAVIAVAQALYLAVS